MSMAEITIIPNDLYDEEVLRSRHDLNRYSEARIEDITNSARQLVRVGESAVAAGLILPSGLDYDESRVLVMPNPFGNGLSPAMVLRGMMLQRSVRGGESPLIILPNNTIDEYAYALTPRPLAQHDRRYYSPLEDLGLQQARAIDKLIKDKTDQEAEYEIIGYSQAAAVAPFIASCLGGVKAMLSADAPNTEPGRTPKQLKKAFMQTKLADLNGAIHDSGILALNHFQGLSHDGRATRRQLWGLLKAYRSSREPNNRMLHEAMASGMHIDDLKIARLWHPEDLYIGAARAQRSKIFLKDSFDKYRSVFAADPQFDFFEFSDYGHEAGDNITQLAQFARTALSKRQSKEN